MTAREAGPDARTAEDRSGEWFVPRFGPPGFRYAVGLLFLPYTGMVISFAVLGSLLAPRVAWGRVFAIAVIYFLGLGIAAHALDALGAGGARPWGAAFTRRQLKALAAGALVLAYAIGVYYIVRHVPWLWTVALLEGFFVFAYNLEWFGGRFHTDGWFAFSWGFLPVLAGHLMQTNGIGAAALLLGGAAALFSLVEITVSRPYKELKRRAGPLPEEEAKAAKRYETVLQSISTGVILLAAALAAWRLASG
ncbi:MAG: hypothetical protein SCH98_05630 [Deferrisomatales bacterium]|nr:hypothetical protein [Deferrisomatales bacterium]